MKIYVTSHQQATLDLWAGLLPEAAAIEYVSGNIDPAQVDALAISGIWAFDRYGGKPSREAAQIVSNKNGDGLPGWIIIPPFRPVTEQSGEISIRKDFKHISPTYHAVLESLRAARERFGESASVALDLPMLGMDNPRDEATAVSASRAIETFLNE
ncbi:hypothetical protein [Streptomyces odontomachi]|uniref:hypothetical protein n=1 Tax=Streptomyces odontomachi TaxID=2944940 RepID=UPI00210C7D58|nr:hypothetical protein [Streptomyces sp. ODS25]